MDITFILIISLRKIDLRVSQSIDILEFRMEGTHPGRQMFFRHFVLVHI